ATCSHIDALWGGAVAAGDAPCRAPREDDPVQLALLLLSFGKAAAHGFAPASPVHELPVDVVGRRTRVRSSRREAPSPGRAIPKQTNGMCTARDSALICRAGSGCGGSTGASADISRPGAGLQRGGAGTAAKSALRPSAI